MILNFESTYAYLRYLVSEQQHVGFRRSFGPHKCCHPQISDLGFIISWWQLSCEIFLQILTSLELHSNSANRPGILLSHDGSLEVNLLMIFLELSLKKTSRMTKSDICGWQHLRVPKYLLDLGSQVKRSTAGHDTNQNVMVSP